MVIHDLYVKGIAVLEAEAHAPLVVDAHTPLTATIPLALNDAISSGRLKKGQLVLLASVGAGFTVGAVLRRWGF